MKTDDYIRLLAADAAGRRPLSHRLLLGGALAGGVIGAVGFVALVPGLRPGVSEFIVLSPLFQVKFGYCLALALLAIPPLMLAMRPHRRPGRLQALAMTWVALLGVNAVFVLMLKPMVFWATDLFVFRFGLKCVLLVLASALPAFALLFLAARRLAPADPALAGRMIGLSAGGIGAAAYVLHCSVDNAVYMFCWYGAAWLILISLGGWLGPRLLRW